MKLQNTFVQSIMNKDVDERLLPKGQYPHAENIRVSNSDGSDVGAIENIKGNEALTDLGLTNAKCIGTVADNSNRKIYWFVTSNEKDLVLEYDRVANITITLLESTNPNGVLNFSKDFLITGVNKLINDNSDDDLLFWTDNLNPPRVINIERFKGSAPDSFTQTDISVIKAPPLSAPEFTFSLNTESSIDSLDDKFLSFAYRYKYLDGEYSALSSFTNYAFAPSELNIDFDTLENRGMRNAFNALNITLNSGGKNVKEVQLCVKEANSNNVYIVEDFIKSEDNIPNNTAINYNFINDKTLRVLPEDELLRTYDNVPRLAKAQDIVGNRLMYANYEEGFDVGKVDYFVEIASNDIEGLLLNLELINSNYDIQIDLANLPLSKDTRLDINISLVGVPPNVDGGGSPSVFNYLFSFILERDYTDLVDLTTSTEFTDFITVIMVQVFDNLENSAPPVGTDSTVRNPFTFSLNGTLLTITSPSQEHTDTDIPITVNYDWNFTINSQATFFRNVSTASLKTNRNLEVGIVYLDEYGRKSTVLVSNTNTVDVPQNLSVFQNRLKVTIPQGVTAPSEAVKYKFVVKQNKRFYDNIITTKFFLDDNFVWYKLEQANKDKIKEGDTLYVKRDSTGVLNEVTKVTVLEVSNQEQNFIQGNFFNQDTGQIVEGPAGGPVIEIIEPSGVYFKVKPINFTATFDINTLFSKKYTGRRTSNGATPEATVDGKRNDFEFFPINTGATITLEIFTIRKRVYGYDGSIFGGRPDATSTTVRKYTALADYATFHDFYITEVGLAPIPSDSFTVEDAIVTVTNDPVNELLFFRSSRAAGGSSRRRSVIDVTITIENSNGLTIFETIPETNLSEIYYETSETFDIINGFHLGKEQSQTPTQEAIHTLDFYNCYAMGEGVESISFLDVFNKPHLSIDIRPSSTSVEKFRKVRRRADITYSEIYNENTNINGLNEFNLARANYKDDITKEFGSIQRIYSRDTDLVVFQEDKVSKVLYGKDLLLNADGSSNVASVQSILGQQVPYTGEYGISFHPESFAFNGNNIYFTDVKRGCVLRLGMNGLTEISQYGMRRYFIDSFRDNFTLPKLGVFNPYDDEYLLNTGVATLSFSETNQGWVSFYSYQPDYMIGMNNNLYSFNQGNLYIHDSDNVNRNTFYNTQYPSKISLMVNDSPSEIKLLQSVSLEGNYQWNTIIKAYVDMTTNSIDSSILESEYIQKEGIWFAYARRNEDTQHFDSKSTYGIGEITSVTPTTLIINGFNNLLTAGDKIIQGNTESIIGTVQNTSTAQWVTTMTLDTTTGLNIGDFVLGYKNPRYEGGNLRGYTMRMDLDVTKNDKVELFAVNSEIFKSYP